MSESAYDRVRLARDCKRPTGLDYVKNIFRGFIELHGDRRFADDPAVVGGIAMLGRTPVTVIAMKRGIPQRKEAKETSALPCPRATERL